MTQIWIVGVCNSGDPNDIRVLTDKTYRKVWFKSFEKRNKYRYVSHPYPGDSSDEAQDKVRLADFIKRDGWYYKDGREPVNEQTWWPVSSQYLTEAD